jgi:GAF domain-containing protein
MTQRPGASGRPVKARRRKTAKAKLRNRSKGASLLGSSAASQKAEIARLNARLNEASEQQTATSEVLQIISSSPGDLQPVFASMLENGVRICNATFGNIYLLDGDALKSAASLNTPVAFAEVRGRSSFRPGPKNPISRMIATKRLVHVTDVAASEAYAERDPVTVAAVELGGVRSLIVIPMLKENELIGALTLARQEVRPFTDKQIELVENFANQAVIAIENARLLNELRQRTTDLTEALEQQTGTSDVLQVISRSPSELEPIFDTILENATRICEANFGVVQVLEDDGLRAVSFHDVPAVYAETMRRDPVFRPVIGHPLHRVASTKQVVHVADVRNEQGLRGRIVELAGARTLLCVPMLKDNTFVGVISIYRQEVRPFLDKQIALVQNFAAQAVIAIENARLLNELRQRTDDLSKRTTDLTEALERQTATSEVLSVISRSPGDLATVFDMMLRRATKLCEATFGGLFLLEGDVFHIGATHLPTSSDPIFKPDVRFSLSDNPGVPLARLVETKAFVHIRDLRTDKSFIERNPRVVQLVESGTRAFLGVPLLRDTEVIGAFGINRQEARPFTDKQIELVTSFAAQAVIAIENARLLKELRERTEDVEKLNRHLERRVADQVGEIERMSRLRRFLPPQVADLIVASGTEKQLESHRREITALFCDLRGFTGFSESADPEDVMTLLREYHEALGASIIKYSGTLERYAGDGVMVVFNDPVPVENPALQAVLMALEMRDAIAALTETWRRWGHEIGFGIGIAHGFATLGTIGFEGRFDYAAIGTVSNVASRLCDEAKPGQILISPRVLTKVENAVKVEPVGEFELKGIRRPLAAYNVVAAAT